MESEGALRRKLDEEARATAKAQAREMQDAFDGAERKLRALLGDAQARSKALETDLGLARSEIASLKKQVTTAEKEKLKSRKVVRELTEIVKELQGKLQGNVQKYEEAFRREHNLAEDRIKKETEELRKAASSAAVKKTTALAELEKMRASRKAEEEEHRAFYGGRRGRQREREKRSKDTHLAHSHTTRQSQPLQCSRRQSKPQRTRPSAPRQRPRLRRARPAQSSGRSRPR